MNVIKTCELFAGIGGFRLGLEKASSQFRTVFANEWDKWAASIYRYHWQDNSLCEKDIRNIQTEDLPDFDLLVGGFPCQPFSVAGKRKGIRDARGTLFQEILRIAKAKQPPMLFLENVPGLLSIEQGKTFQAMLESLGELGYLCEWKVLNSQFFGVPQQRKRLFIIAHTASRWGGGGTVFPIGNSNSICVKEVGEQKVCSTLMASYHSRGGGGTYIVQPRPTAKRDEQFRVYTDTVPTLMARMGTGGGNVPYVLRENQCMRRLTCVECERLQDFPDNWTQHGLTARGKQIEISNTQRYKTLGNAVTTSVIAEVGKLILNFIETNKNEKENVVGGSYGA
ncbi:MAG: DNA (cytosine-5-)-methyltransferase [Candidatus Bathyarchaeota archaeon]|nr:DNA (cytosine-5-)-methyltransferase [Candidatus Termiticorpusculum sp.]